ncbi:unnamed protein product [Aphanomyces euteiches]
MDYESTIRYSDRFKELFDKANNLKEAKTYLSFAVEKGNVDIVNALLVYGARVDKMNKILLIIAAEEGYFDTVKVLLARDATFTTLDKIGNTLKLLATKKGRFNVVKMLVECRTPVRLTKTDGKTLVLDGEYDGIIHGLRSKGDVIPTLYEAAPDGRLDLIREMGQSVALLVKDSNGNTPLHAAARNGHVEIVMELLSRGADVNLQNKHGQTALHEAVNNRDFDVVKTLVDNGALVDIADSTGGTPLHEAAENGHADITTLLLEHKAQVDVLNNGILRYIGRHNQTIDVVKLLLVYGTNVDAANNELWTSLHLAAMKGHVDVVKELLAQNATLDVIDEMDNTPLHEASKHGNMNIVKLLAYAGANKHLVNIDDKLARDLGDEVIQTFLDNYNEKDDTTMSNNFYVQSSIDFEI